MSYCGSRSSIRRSFLSSLEAVVSDCCWKCGFCLSLVLLSSFLGYADQNPRDILCPHLPLEGMCRSAVVSRTQDDWQILVHRFQTLTALMFFRTLQYGDRASLPRNWILCSDCRLSWTYPACLCGSSIRIKS